MDKVPCLGAYAPSGIRTHDPGSDYKSRAPFKISVMKSNDDKIHKNETKPIEG